MINKIFNNQEFFKKLNSDKNKVIYAKIISLNMDDETPQEEITGKIVSGSINVDGTSAVRRTCSLNLVAKDINLNSYYWGLCTKFKIFIGLENHVDSSEDDIIWFPQGIYIITSFSSTQNMNSYNISISGKDKMCLLNGDLGGVLTDISTRFDMDYQFQDDESQMAYKVPIKTIIYKLIHQLGGELISNIIVKDLDDYGVELLEYGVKNPLYIIVASDGRIHQTKIDGKSEVYYKGNKTALNKLSSTSGFIFNNFSPISEITPSVVTLSDGKDTFYTINKREQGDTVGYRLTDITYAGELIGNAGETLTSVLDKIKSQLGDFEYYYDINGKFIFQRVQTSFNIPWSPVIKTTSDDIDLLLQDLGMVNETDRDKFIETISTGDFSILYNTDKDKDDKPINPFYSYIINFTEDEKTIIKNLILNQTSSFSTKDQYIQPKNQSSEIFYNFEGNELVTSLNNSPNLLNIKNDFCIWGKRKSKITDNEIDIHIRYAIDKKPTSYKTYKGDTYSTSNYDWREIIYRMAEDKNTYGQRSDFFTVIAKNNPQTCLNGITGYEAYYKEMEAFWRELYNPDYKKLDKEDRKNFYSSGSMKYWNKNIDINPEVLNFWIDFLDTEGELKKFSIPLIGRRTKVVKNDKIKSIFFRNVPLVIFYSNEIDKDKKSGYTYFKMGQGTEKFFEASNQGKSIQEELNSLLYQHTSAQETITLNTIPIYYLTPNVKIRVKDDQNLDINGEYNVTRFTIPLTYNSTMSIVATKIVDPLK